MMGHINALDHTLIQPRTAYDGIHAPDQISGSNIVNTVDFNHIKDRNDTINFLKHVLPKAGRAQPVQSVMDPSKPHIISDYQSYFFMDRKYLVGDTFRFSF